MPANNQTDTNFVDRDGGDLGTNLVTKDYLISVYPELAESLGKSSTILAWGYNDEYDLGNIVRYIVLSTPSNIYGGGTNWKQVDANGDRISAAIKTDGTLWTWGNNTYNGLGIPSAYQQVRSTPITTFAGGTNWKQLSCGYSHTAAIKTDGTLWLWGLNSNGQCGNITAIYQSPDTLYFQNTTIPVTTVVGGTDWKQVSCGYNHTAAIKTDGTLWVWGMNQGGELGVGIDKVTYRSTPVTTFVGGTDWAAVPSIPEDLYTIAVGVDAIAAIKSNGTLWTWGSNAELLINTPTQQSKKIPNTTFTGGTTWKEIDGSIHKMSAIKTDGTLWHWGRIYNSEFIGSGGYNGTNPTQPIGGGTTWNTCASGATHTAAIKTDGTLWLWGGNSYSQLGNNSDLIVPDNASTPVTTFAGGTNWKQVSCGNRNTAAIKTDGTLWVWGSNAVGQLGINDTVVVNKSTPVTTFAGGTNWKQVSCGYGGATAAIKTDGTLWIWGYNFSGQLGTNDATNRSTPVTTFAGGTNWKQVSTDGSTVAAVKTDGTLWVWGDNYSSRNGTGSAASDVSTPITTFAGGTNWNQVFVGANHTVATRSIGVGSTELVILGGTSEFGTLGIDLDITSTYTPMTTFAGGNNWKVVTSSSQSTFSIKTDGTLWVWGNNFSGQLGTNDTFNKFTPVTTFAGGTNWKQVDGPAAIKTDGTLWVWGDNNNAQLGTNNTTNTSTPVTTFAGGTHWKKVSNGVSHVTAIKTDGTLWTWGANSGGQLGTNNATNRSTPVTTFVGGSNWKNISNTSQKSMAITSLDGI